MEMGYPVFGLVVGLFATSLSAGQIASYVADNGRRVFVNAEEALKTEKSSRTSVLVRRDARTRALVTVPVRPVAEETAPKPQDAGATVAAEKPEALDAKEAGKAAEETGAGDANVVPQRLFVPAHVDDMIAETAERHDVDPTILRALIKTESNFNPRAISHKGAMGLMQLMPATARQYGVRNAFDPGQNLDGGVRHFKYLLALYEGNLHLSLAAYNAGEGAVRRYNGIPPYRETQQYVRKISSMYRGGSSFAPRTQQPDRWQIMKHVDPNGKVHFSNTEGF